MGNSEEIEPPLITAIRLARMREGSMGQAEEIQSLMEILKGSENLLTIVNDTVWSLMTKKPKMSQTEKRLLFEESFRMLTQGMDKFVNAKIKRIEKFIRYFQILQHNVIEERTKLEIFEKDWEKTQRELEKFNLDHFLNMPVNDSYEQANYFKNNILKTSLPILQKLTELENQMQKRVLEMIAFIAIANKPVNSNDLYKLLTDEL